MDIYIYILYTYIYIIYIHIYIYMESVPPMKLRFLASMAIDDEILDITNGHNWGDYSAITPFSVDICCSVLRVIGGI